MKKKSLVFLLTLAMVFTFVLSACSGGSSEGGEEAAAEETLKVVTEATFAPYEFMEDGNDEIVGFDVDMMEAIAEDQGLKLEWENLEFDSLIPALESKQGDIICAGMNKLSGDRAKKVDFGDTYLESDLKLLVKADSDIKSVDDLTKDAKLASQLGTTGADVVQELEKEGKIGGSAILNQWTDCYMQLQNGDVAGVVVDMPVGQAYLNEHSDIAKFVGDALGEHEELAFAVQKGNTELLDKLNKGLANLKESGKFDELVDKWFKN